MKRIVVAFLMLTGSLLACTTEDHQLTPDHLDWSPLPALPDVFCEEASSFSIGAKAYFGLGNGNTTGRYRENAIYMNDLWEFNSVTTSWRRLADFPGHNRGRAVSFAIKGRGYVGYGYSTTCDLQRCDFTFYHDMWEYNPTTNTWTNIALVNAPSGLFDRSFVINNKAYLLGDTECYEFDPTTYSFRKRAACPLGSFSGQFSLNNKGYVFLNDQNKGVYEYTPATDSWARKKDFPGQPRQVPASFSLNGFGYCGGGELGGNPYQFFKDFWQYNPTSDEWTRIEDYPGMGSVWLQSMVIGNTVVVGSGYKADPYRYDNNFWLLQPK